MSLARIMDELEAFLAGSRHAAAVLPYTITELDGTGREIVVARYRDVGEALQAFDARVPEPGTDPWRASILYVRGRPIRDCVTYGPSAPESLP